MKMFLKRDVQFVVILYNYAIKKPMAFVYGFVRTNPKYVIS